MGLIKELDVLLAYCEEETKKKRMTKRDYSKTLKAVDTLKNIIENLKD